jgi:C4-dicarboxylate-specific signal transduction histidine kinase
MAYANEIVFLMTGLIVMGMTIHAVSLYDGEKDARPSRFLITAFLLADVSCLATLAVRSISPAFLTVVNSGLLLTIWAVALTARSWRMAVSRRLVLNSGAWMLCVPLSFELLRQHGTYMQRVVLYTTLSALLLCWVLFEVLQKSKQDKTFSLKFVMGAVLASLLLRIGRMVFVLQQAVQPESLLHEMPAAAMMRNLSVSMDVLILSSLVAYSTHRLALRYQQTQSDNQAVRLAHEELKAVLQEKEQMLRALTTSTKSRNMGVLLASLAHELNQPMATMRLKVDFLLSQPDLAAEDRQAFLQELMDDNTRAADIIAQLRRFMRHGSDALQPVALDLVVAEALQLVSSEVERLQVQLQQMVTPDTSVMAQEGQLQMVVLNLLRNALDAMKPVAGQKALQVNLSCSTSEVVLTVSDSGPGIPEAQWERVFDLFYTTKPEGMGLGLWLSRSIVQSQGGAMTVSRSPLGGALFTLSWPRIASSPIGVDAPKAQTP